MAYKSPVHAFEEIVRNVSRNVLAQLQVNEPNIKQVNYLYGHWKEVSQKLIDMGQNTHERWLKFPLVVLIEDIAINEGNARKNTGIFQLGIFHNTSQNYTSQERQVKVFESILYPIYDELFNQIERSTYFVQTDRRQMSRKRYDRKFFGRDAAYGSEANVAMEFLDAIQIQDLTLNIAQQYC